MKEKLPTKNDRLFIEEIEKNYGAWMKDPPNKFFLYSEGYKDAGEKLFEFCIENKFYISSMIYPLVFNYRQFIELRIKELSMMGNTYLGNDIDFADEHSLLKLWNNYRNNILAKIHKVDDEILNNVERIISEFNSEDPKSMCFRYPVTRAPNRKESVNRETIDLNNFKFVIDKLINFFYWQWELISNNQDLKNEFLAEMYSQYY